MSEYVHGLHMEQCGRKRNWVVKKLSQGSMDERVTTLSDWVLKITLKISGLWTIGEGRDFVKSCYDFHIIMTYSAPSSASPLSRNSL